jgi:hypothetical protein
MPHGPSSINPITKTMKPKKAKIITIAVTAKKSRKDLP